MYLLVLFLAAGLVAVCANPPAAKYPKCDSDMVDNIKAYWAGAGTPTNFFSTEGVFKSYKSSALNIYKDVKCRTYDFIPEEKMEANVDGTEMTGGFVEKDGVLTLPDRKTYIIMNEDGVIAEYSCCEKIPDDTPYAGPKLACNLYLTKDADPNSLAHAEGILQLLGCDLTKEYDCN